MRHEIESREERGAAEAPAMGAGHLRAGSRALEPACPRRAGPRTPGGIPLARALGLALAILALSPPTAALAASELSLFPPLAAAHPDALATAAVPTQSAAASGRPRFCTAPGCGRPDATPFAHVAGFALAAVGAGLWSRRRA